MPNIFGNNNVSPPGVPIPPGPMGPQGPQGPPGPAAIQEEGVSLPARGYLNFVGTGVSASDDAAHNRVTVTVTSGGATPGGPVTSIQVNDAGALAGYPSLTYDGLTLQGQQLAYVCTNPQFDDPSYKRAWDLLVYSDNLNTPTNYAGSGGLMIQHKVSGGYYNADDNFQNKTTTYGADIRLFGQGASQAFALNLTVVKDSMGDCGALGGSVTYRGGPMSGDEGQCFQCFTHLDQSSEIIIASIVSVRRSACPANMTVTQAVTASQNPQTVNVSGTTGLAVNDWLVAGQSADTGPQHIRAVRVISFTATTITAVIAVNMASGDPLKAALVLGVSTARFGQLVPLVNLSGAVYQTGTVSSISGGNFLGTGTAWAPSVVGGDSLNIGAISLVADDITDPPFDATPPGTGGHMLRSWYQIQSVTSAGQLAINSYSVAADRAYRGKGPGAGQYLIKPAARVLWIPDGGTAICEYSAHAWNVGDIVESIVCPYPDVSLQQWTMAAYTPGGTYRGGISIVNNGLRTFGTAFAAGGNMPTGGNSDLYPWGTAFASKGPTSRETISTSGSGTGTSLFIRCNAPSDPGRICWHDSPTNGGFGIGFRHDLGQFCLAIGDGNADYCAFDFSSVNFGTGFPTWTWPPKSGIVAMTSDAPPPILVRRDIPGAVNDAVDIGTLDLTSALYYTGVFVVTTAHLRRTKQFRIAASYSAMVAGPGAWVEQPPTSDTGDLYGGDMGGLDYALDSVQWGSSIQLRLRRTSSIGTSAGAPLDCQVQIEWAGMSIPPTLAPSSAVTTVSPPAAYMTDYAVHGGPLYVGKAPGLVSMLDPSALSGNRTITLPDASGTMVLTPLPSSSPGSGKLWYDPADSNRVKYTP